MPSPDLTAYVDLTVADVDPQTVFDRALAAVEVVFPDWIPREGNTEVVLLEALATETAELVFALNRLPSAVVQIIMQLYGITPNLGVPADCTVDFYLADLLGHTIPAGTQVRVEVSDDSSRWVVFETDAEVIVDVGYAVGTAAATAVTAGADLNGTAAGLRLNVLSPLPFVNRAVLATEVGSGAAAETTEQWIARATNVLRRLTDSLVRPHEFAARTLEHYPQVARALALNAWDPGSGNPAGADLGHLTVLVAGVDAAVISSPDRADITADLEALAVANLIVHVVAPTVVTVDVAVTVRRYADTPAVTVEAAVEAAVTAALDVNVWPFGQNVYRNEIVSLVDAVAGVDLVVTVADPAADVPVDAGELAKAGTVTVTVLEP